MGRQEEGNFQWGSYCWVHNTTFADHADFIKHLEQVSHVPAEEVLKPGDVLHIASVNIIEPERTKQAAHGKANR